MREIILAKCNKTVYRSKRDAISTLKSIHEEGRKDQLLPKRAYFCNKCRGWHLTKNENQVEVNFTFFMPKDNKIIEQINEIVHESNRQKHIPAGAEPFGQPGADDTPGLRDIPEDE